MEELLGKRIHGIIETHSADCKKDLRDTPPPGFARLILGLQVKTTSKPQDEPCESWG